MYIPNLQTNPDGYKFAISIASLKKSRFFRKMQNQTDEATDSKCSKWLQQSRNDPTKKHSTTISQLAGVLPCRKTVAVATEKSIHAVEVSPKVQDGAPQIEVGL